MRGPLASGWSSTSPGSSLGMGSMATRPRTERRAGQMIKRFGCPVRTHLDCSTSHSVHIALPLVPLSGVYSCVLRYASSMERIAMEHLSIDDGVEGTHQGRDNMQHW